MKAIIFDIETVALPEDKMPPFQEENVPLGNLKDPDKIAAKIMEAKLERIAGAAKNPETGQVAMVGFMMGDEVDIRSGDEKEILEGSLKLIWNAVVGGNIVAGFCCYDFDLRFLLRRAWINGIKVLPNIREGRYWNRNIIDLHEVWLLGDRAPAKGTTKLDYIAALLGLPPKLGKGEDFAKLNHKQRIEYLKRDLEITKLLYERIA